MEIKKEQLLKAIRVLKEVVQKGKNDNELFTNSDKLSLQFSLIKIFPGKEKILKIELPHKLVSLGTCLFVADVDQTSRKHEETTASYESLLHKHKVEHQIDVFPLKRVKLEYNDYERKRHLSNFYDVFLCDARIIRLMPEILGKHFIGRKKYLVQVRMDEKDLRGEIEKGLSTVMCAIKNRGATSTATFGDLSMGEQQLLDNLERVIEKVVGEVKGGWANLRSLSIKGEQSLAVPIYQSKASKESVKVDKKAANGVEGVKKVRVSGVKGKVDVGVAEEVSTVRNARVLVTQAGDVVVIANKRGGAKVEEGHGEEEEEEEEEEDDGYPTEDEEEDEKEEEEEEVDYEKKGARPKRSIKESVKKVAKKIKLDVAPKEKKGARASKDSKLKEEAEKDSMKPVVRKLVVARKSNDLRSSGAKLVNYSMNNSRRGRSGDDGGKRITRKPKKGKK